MTAKQSARSKIAVQNVNVPGSVTNVDAIKYALMKTALLKALPKKPPGLTQSEMIAGAKNHLPETEFPGGEKAGWWVKCVQLDLEAKGEVIRDKSAKPLRWTKA